MPPSLEEMQEALGHPLLYPEEFKDYISDYVATHLPEIPITQVYGFHVERFRDHVINTSESTSSTSYTNLATTGPTIDKLPDGVYLVFVGFKVVSSLVDQAMSFSVDGAAAVDDNAAFGNHSGSTFKCSIVDLRSPLPVHQHSLVAKYKVPSGVSRAFSKRFMIALKVVSDAQ